MADYNAKRPPLFNAKKGWRTLKEPLVCTHDKCYAGCDIDWATKWINEKGAKEPKLIKAQTKHPSKAKLWIQQTIDRPLRNMIHIIWAPTLICNYTCMYCGCAVGKHDIFKDFPSASPELSVDKWIDIWYAIRRNYTFGILTMAGGESLLSKATLPVIKMISDKFAVGLTTNLSVNVMGILRYGIRPPNKELEDTGLQVITGSLHPTAREFSREVFFGSLLYLKNNGFNVAVNFVGYPLQLFLAEEYKQWCEQYGIDFIVSPWCGHDNQGFIAKYTAVEENFLNKIAPSNRKTETQTEFYSFNSRIETNIAKLEVRQEGTLFLKGKIKNTGTVSWENTRLEESQAYKIGGKIMKYGGEKNVLREFRAALPDKCIMPEQVFNFKSKIDIKGLEKGIYIIKLDMLKENCFWFEDKSHEPLEIELKIV